MCHWRAAQPKACLDVSVWMERRMDGQTRDTWKAVPAVADLCASESSGSKRPVLQCDAGVSAVVLTPRGWRVMLLTKLWVRPGRDHGWIPLIFMSIIKHVSASAVLGYKTGQAGKSGAATEFTRSIFCSSGSPTYMKLRAALLELGGINVNHSPQA